MIKNNTRWLKKFVRKKYLLRANVGLVVLLTGLIGAFYVSSPKPAQPVAKLTQSEYIAEKEELTKRLKTFGLAKSFAYARERIDSNSSFAQSCHPLLHELGHAAFEQYGSFSNALNEQDEMCNSAFLHGLIEASFKAITYTKATINSICPETADETFQLWQCFHGIGHGVMYASEKNILESLELCAGLASTFASNSCANGVFMERFIVVNHSGEQNHTMSLTDIAVCKQQTIDNKHHCYFYAPSAYLELHANKFSDAIALCKNIESNYISTCISGIGSHAMKDNISNPDFAARLCNRAIDSYAASCARGAIGIFINHHASSAKAEQLCNNEFKSFKQTCREVIDHKKSLLKI